jgi:ELP3 family radical SAM enzyme/protein acetyltransferase
MDIEDIAEDFKSITDVKQFEKFKLSIQRKYKIVLSKPDLISIYNNLNINDITLKNLITKKKQKSTSGVIVITVLTSGNPSYYEENGEIITSKFSCKHNCAYCPNEKAHIGNGFIDQPRSYLYSEPAVLRANANDFDPIKQFNARVSTLISMGHIVDKVELIVLGGTWSEYPKKYQDWFITSIYYAANTYIYPGKSCEKSINSENIIMYKGPEGSEGSEGPIRPMKTLLEEITINETAKIHIIGLTLETRPDNITLEEIKELRKYNCTRVQLGVQHTDNSVLKKIQRGHTIEAAYNAIKLLKNNCFKVDIHLMPNLPGSSYEKDEQMLNDALYDERLQVDQYKIYPCAVVPWTKIKTWFDDGSYIPYADTLLFTLIKNFKIKVQKWKRLNRIIRDIPSSYITGGYKDVNMRQLLQNDMKKYNWKCNCIRCREIKDNKLTDDIEQQCSVYTASGGTEYFISYESTEYLIGFIRLRLNSGSQSEPSGSQSEPSGSQSEPSGDSENILPILKDCALIRELHVYSNLSNVGEDVKGSYQHKGFGRKLIEKAEDIALKCGYHKIAIISGTGARDYYRKFGYTLEDTYMIKNLTTKNSKLLNNIFSLFSTNK